MRNLEQWKTYATKCWYWEVAAAVDNFEPRSDDRTFIGNNIVASCYAKSLEDSGNPTDSNVLRQWENYSTGTRLPGEKTLKFVESEWGVPADFHRTGPNNAPLWKVLSCNDGWLSDQARLGDGPLQVIARFRLDALEGKINLFSIARRSKILLSHSLRRNRGNRLSKCPEFEVLEAILDFPGMHAWARQTAALCLYQSLELIEYVNSPWCLLKNEEVWDPVASLLMKIRKEQFLKGSTEQHHQLERLLKTNPYYPLRGSVATI